jgi:hypothetical protein
MKQQEVFKKISGIIKEINEQYEYLETANGVYNDLELELLAANAHFLSDHIDILKKLNVAAVAPVPNAAPAPTKQEVAEDKPTTEPRYFEPVMDSPEEPAMVDPEVMEEPAHTIEFEIGSKVEQETVPEAIAGPVAEEPAPEKTEPETIRHELTLEDIGEDWDEEDDEAEDIELEPEPIKSEEVKPEPAKVPEPVVAEAKPEPVQKTAPIAKEPEPIPAPEVIAVKHTQILVEEEQVITLNQRMSAQMSASRVSDQLVGQPISDLKGAITLNDKMLYVKDLFNGYSLAYSEALDILNRLKTFEDAQSFLKASYATKNNWADKEATANKFYALLQRRYL